MIKLPTETEIETLQAFKKPDCISIYSSYIAPSSPNNPNRIQLKNLLKESRQLLMADGINAREVGATLKPVDKLLDGDEFRLNHKHSLALFIQRDFFAYYRLPAEDMVSSVRIDDGFFVQPIIEMASTNPNYYVLLLSHNHVQLLKGDCYYIESLNVPGLPTNMERELNIDEYPSEIQTHSIAPASRGKSSEAFHGQYNDIQVDKDLLVQFFRRIDRRLRILLRDTKTPLIIAGVDYLLPLYRQVSTYPNLLIDEIRGNLEHASLNAILARTSTILVQSS